VLLGNGDIRTIFEGRSWETKRVQLATKREFSGILEEFVKEDLREDLSPASLETLSLVVYLGPIAKSKLDYIRGINSSFILRTLMLRGLVERIQDQERSHVFLYLSTMECLRYLGVEKPEDLPEYEKFRALLDEENTSEVSYPKNSSVNEDENVK